MSNCEHGQFQFNGTIVLRAKEQKNWCLALRVRCTDCDAQFYFRGIDAVGIPEATCPTISEDRQELRIYINPEPDTPLIPDGQLRQ